ncbi:hypothetical protein RchiOBHm_Chr5g0034221 [Rosa chinensis]|uniref:RING-type E3 ubiquitin transferase n=1 Tax=Rosa chinensis TaxID=74649 RepID=A0A2P6QAW0_ROSCH|nr:hypothetical protein RchiOBHm_Chr5g0034221 [Rosa chinensis]
MTFLQSQEHSLHEHSSVFVEIVLVLISTILASVLVASQLFHVKKHQDVLPSISFLMPLILSLGYLIPLMVNIEAIFMHDTERQNLFFGSGEWLQFSQENVREITVITMVVALLLHFLLLQQIWSAQSVKGIITQLWNVEKIEGFTCICSRSFNFYAASDEFKSYRHPMLSFSCYRAYAGLILNGFLLPQIVLNMVCKSKGRALSLSFYWNNYCSCPATCL